MKTRRAVLSVLALALAISVAGVAVAVAAPASFSPMRLKSVGFENATTDNLTDIEGVQIAGDPATTAFWGRTTASKRTGSYGLWCAGSVYPGGAPSTFWPKYPEWTRGQGELPLLQLTDYYSATLDFWYLMPTRGVADDGSFGLFWNTEPPGALNDFKASFGLAPQWTKSSVTLTNPAGRQPLSREPGRLWFRFNDKAEGNQTPKVGQGATIDDVSVSVYKYGPVRSLQAVPSATSVQLSWLKPYRSTTQNTVEERAVAYRVWRAPAGTSAWQELTGTRTTAISYTDNTTDGTGFDYAVQAWDTGKGAGYGQHVRVSVLGSPGIAERLFGVGRYETAVELSRRAFPSAHSVSNIVVASGNGFADALSASGLAGAHGSPILLVPARGAVSTAVKQEVERLAAPGAKVWVVGGGAVVDDSVAGQLKTASISAVGRIEGSDRYQTSAAVAAEIKRVRGAGFVKTAFVASGASFPDALSASPIAFARAFPVLLTEPSRLSKATRDAIKANGITHAMIAGGPVAVSTATESEVKSEGVAVERWSGADRYKTAVQVAQNAKMSGWASYSYTGVASGENFPDALAGGPLAGSRGGVMVLSQAQKLPAATNSFLESNRSSIKAVQVYGGPVAVNGAVINAINRALE